MAFWELAVIFAKSTHKFCGRPKKSSPGVGLDFRNKIKFTF
jgi:hypothetical protein